jgi:hypothetical protein
VWSPDVDVTILPFGENTPSNLPTIDSLIVMLQMQFVLLHWFKPPFTSKVLNPLQNPGQNTYASSVSFLSNSIDALELVISSVLSTQPWLRDPEVVAIPWR